MLISCFVFCILTAGCHGRAKGRRKGGCSACNAVRIMPCALAVVRYGTRLILQRHIRAWCPHSACLSFGNSRRPDIMGIGQEDTSTYFFEHQYSFGLDAGKRREEGDWQPDESHPERWTVKETDRFLFTLDTTGRLAMMPVDR